MPDMKALARAVVAALISGVIPAALLAQWPPFPTHGVPKLANGEPNLDGPTPHTVEGKPDLSGIWHFVGSPGTAPGPPAPPPAGGIGQGSRPPGISEFFD